MCILKTFVVLVALSIQSLAQNAGKSKSDSEVFHEELLLRTLPTGDLLASFSFTTLSPSPADTSPRRHFDLLPRFVGDMIDEHGVFELDISLSRGVWRSRFWGYPPRPTATGTRVSAFFKPEISDLDKAWTKLVNALSGQFCASLNFLDTTQAVQPKWTFQPRGVTPIGFNATSVNEHFRFGTLPGENVCTENLTPWKKLLPCEAKRGLATLLNSHSIHKTRYHSIGLSIRLVCPFAGEMNCIDPVVELNQNVVLVFDPATISDNRHYPVKKHDWSIRNLFGIGIMSVCPLATSSRIFIDVGDGSSTGHLNPTDIAEKITSKNGRETFIFEVAKMVDRGVQNIQLAHDKDPVYGILKPPTLHTTRYLVGHGHQSGGIVTKIVNTDPSQPIDVVYLDVVPWFLRIFLHTLHVVDGSTGKEVQPRGVNFVPGVDRERPYTIELVLRVPPKSFLQISIGFEHSLLKWLEYPPDANKGFYVGSAVVSTLVDSRCQNLTHILRHTSTYYDTLTLEVNHSETSMYEILQLYTESLLVNLPTPDFSMPYNVICLTCTVVALAFGPLHNITTKSLVIVRTDSSGAEKQTIVGKIKSFFSRKKNTTTASPTDDNATEEPNVETESKKDK